MSGPLGGFQDITSPRCIELIIFAIQLVDHTVDLGVENFVFFNPTLVVCTNDVLPVVIIIAVAHLARLMMRRRQGRLYLEFLLVSTCMSLLVI